MKLEDVKPGMFLVYDAFPGNKWYIRIITVEVEAVGVVATKFKMLYKYDVEILFTKDACMDYRLIFSSAWRDVITRSKESDSKTFYKIKKVIEVYHNTITSIINDDVLCE